jgi:uncharacterized membrane protein (DUF485 family)
MNELEKYEYLEKKIDKIVVWCFIVFIVIYIISAVIYGFSKVCSCYEILVDSLISGLLISGLCLFSTVIVCSLTVLSEK